MNTPQSPLHIVSKRTQLLAKFRNEAQRQALAVENIQQQFAFEMFLTRLFSRNDCGWVLKGGTSLLLRIGSGRRSRDIDLARREQSPPSEALKELQSFVDDPGPTDPDFSFKLIEPARDNKDPQDRTRGSFKVLLMIGTQQIVQFKIDISTQQYLDMPVERVEIKPVIKHDSLPKGTLVDMVPVENVVADKLCACYELHRGQPSTRYHDLIDLVRIVVAQEMDAKLLQKTINRETVRRHLSLPQKIEIPGQQWVVAYPNQASKAADFPSKFHDLDISIKVVGNCLNPFLNGEVPSGTWNPRKQSWGE